MHSLAQACKPRESIFDKARRDTVLDLTDLVQDRIRPARQEGTVRKPLLAALSAGQTAWVNLLEGDPLLIMLDELPPYFEDAKSKTIGNSDLSVVTATALSNLLVAIGKDELSNVYLIITDLNAAYGPKEAAVETAVAAP